MIIAVVIMVTVNVDYAQQDFYDNLDSGMFDDDFQLITL